MLHKVLWRGIILFPGCTLAGLLAWYLTGQHGSPMWAVVSMQVLALMWYQSRTQVQVDILYSEVPEDQPDENEPAVDQPGPPPTHNRPYRQWNEDML